MQFINREALHLRNETNINIIYNQYQKNMNTKILKSELRIIYKYILYLYKL